MGEFDKITQRAVARIHAVIIGNVIAVITTRRNLKGHQPNGRDAETMQIIQPPRQAGEIADPVAIGIHIGPDRQAVCDRVLVPEVVYHSGVLVLDPLASGHNGGPDAGMPSVDSSPSE